MAVSILTALKCVAKKLATTEDTEDTEDQVVESLSRNF